MQKNILFLVFIMLFIYQVNGQQYRITYTGSAVSEVCGPGDNSFSRVYIENDIQSALLLNSTCGGLDVAFNEEVIISFKSNKLQHHQLLSGAMNTTISDTDINFAHCHNQAEIYSSADIDITIEPVIDIESTSPGEIGLCETIQLNATNSGFETNVYNWEYYTSADGWNTLPGFQGQASIEVGIGDIPGAPLTAGDIVRFRIEYCTGEYTPHLEFDLIICSPNVVGNPVTTPPTCDGDTNGGFTIYFDRPLEPLETLNFNLYVGAISDGMIIENQNMMGLGADDNYVWPTDLIPETYSIRYQSADDGSPIGIPIDVENIVIGDPPPALEITEDAITSVSCTGGNDGAIDVSVLGGTLPYTYSWNSGTYTTDDLLNVPAGDYTLTVTDANGCQAISGAIPINQPAAALAISNIIVTDATAFGFATGTIDITVSGGTSPPYTYSWNNGATTQDLTGIPAGNYQVTVTDANGCQATSASIPVNQPPVVSINIDASSGVSCNGDTDGSITVSATGGYQDFRYTLRREQTPGNFVFVENSPVTNASHPFTGLIPGIYRVQVTDNGGAGDGTDTSGNIPIGEPAVLEITGVSITNVNCTGESTGVIDVSVSGGTSPYTYAWSNGAIGQDINNVPAGLYTLTITDDNGCTIDLFPSVEITEPVAVLSVSTPAASDIENPLSAGASDGYINITVSGGTGAYNFSWTKTGDPGFSETTQNISALNEGFYNITVIDDNGCMAMETYELIEPEPLLAEIIETQFILCNGDSNGELTVNATGGVTEPGDGYDFFWTKTGDPGFSETTQTISGINTGEYHVEVTDNNGITTSTSYTINEPPVLSFNYTQTDNLCYNAAEGSIEITPAGGTPPYLYSIDNGANFQPAPLFSNLSAGNYTLVVEDANGCSTTQGTVITQPEELLVNSVVVDITAYQYDDGSISITVSGGTAPYSIEWFGDNGFASTDEDIANLGPGNYTLIVQDANYAASGGDIGCSYMEEFTVIEPEELLVSVIEDFSLLCFGDSDGELFADVSGGVVPYQYEWFSVDGGMENSIGQTLDYATNLIAGQYRVIITDANGIQVISEIHDLQQPELLVIQHESTTDILCHGDATGAIDVSILGGTPPYIINWSNGATSEDITDIEAGVYSITVEDANGCMTMENIEVIHLYDTLSLENVNITHASSYRAKDGSISVTPLGGAVPYVIEWMRFPDGFVFSNVEDISNLNAGDYQITVTDVYNCTISETYTIIEPDIVEAVITVPSCYDSCDGSIVLIANEGNDDGSLSYFWDTGSTGSILSNVCAGSYMVTIVGYNDDILQRTYEVLNPELLIVDLGEDRTLCSYQVITLSAAIEDTEASYSWTSTNGFVSNQPEVYVSEAGTYTVTVTSGNGCEATDEIVIQTTEEEIDADFLVASQVFVGEPLIIVDISHPVPDDVEWILPENAIVVEQQPDFVEIMFETAGEYEIGMLTRRGACETVKMKTVLVIEGENFEEDETVNPSNAIEEFIVYPNPSNGNFSIEVTLKKRGNANIKIFGLANNALLSDVTGYNSTTYVFPLNLTLLPAGLYAVVLETPFGSQVRKIIIE